MRAVLLAMLAGLVLPAAAGAEPGPVMGREVTGLTLDWSAFEAARSADSYPDVASGGGPVLTGVDSGRVAGAKPL